MSASVSDISRSSLLALSLSVVAEAATTMAPESPPAPVNATASPSNVAPVLPMQFNPALALVVLVIIICFFLAALATTFLKRFARPGEADTEDAVRRRSRSRTGGPTSKSQCGLDPEILEALPRVHYKDLPADEQVQKYLDCPVCLAPFDADDTLRLLPVCSHAFHSGCVDAWFLSHNTCPLCRACLALPMGKESREERGDNAENGEQIEISVSEGFDVAEVVIDGDTEQDRSGSAAISGFLPGELYISSVAMFLNRNFNCRSLKSTEFVPNGKYVRLYYACQMNHTKSMWRMG